MYFVYTNLVIESVCQLSLLNVLPVRMFKIQPVLVDKHSINTVWEMFRNASGHLNYPSLTNYPANIT